MDLCVFERDPREVGEVAVAILRMQKGLCGLEDSPVFMVTWGFYSTPALHQIILCKKMWVHLLPLYLEHCGSGLLQKVDSYVCWKSSLETSSGMKILENLTSSYICMSELVP